MTQITNNIRQNTKHDTKNKCLFKTNLCVFSFIDSLYVCFWEAGATYFLRTCNITVIRGLFKGKGSVGNRRTERCMIISGSAGGKHEQKSLRDREGPHRSPGPLLNHFWTAVIHYALLGLFLRPIPGECYSLSV